MVNEIVKSTRRIRPAKKQEIVLGVATITSLALIPFVFNPLTIAVGALCTIASGVMFFCKKEKREKRENPAVLARKIRNEARSFYFDTYEIANDRHTEFLFHQAVSKYISGETVSKSLGKTDDFHVVVPSFQLKIHRDYRAYDSVFDTEVFAVYYSHGTLKLQTVHYEMEKFNADFTSAISQNGDMDELLRKTAETCNEKRQAIRKKKGWFTDKEKLNQKTMEVFMGYSDDDDISYNSRFRKVKKIDNPYDSKHREVFKKPPKIHSRTVEL